MDQEQLLGLLAPLASRLQQGLRGLRQGAPPLTIRVRQRRPDTDADDQFVIEPVTLHTIRMEGGRKDRVLFPLESKCPNCSAEYGQSIFFCENCGCIRGLK